MSDKCIACGGPVNFTVQLILSSRGAAPRRQHGSKAIGVCDSCCKPGAAEDRAGWELLKRALAAELWMNRNEHMKKLETIPGEVTDGKTAAAGE
jgi:hypothetical protein